jgi:predicted NBD/HSP70 family sugar kinase
MVTTVKRVKAINTSRVMREIWMQRSISRVDISKRTGLNKSTITHIVNELMEKGLVRRDSIGEASPQGGRRPIYLTLNEKFGCILGIELRPESYSAVAVDLVGDITFSKSERMKIAGSDIADSYRDIIERLEIDCTRSGAPLLGVGVGLAGVVNPYKRTIKYSIPLKLDEQYDFFTRISEKYPIPVFPENDANCCALGELAFHREYGLKNFLFVLVEIRDVADMQSIYEKTAVGMGIVIEGKLYHGTNYSAGEFRSVFRSSDNRGQVSLSDHEARVVDTDTAVTRKFIRELSKNIALLVNTFNLEIVFLGGDIEKYQSEVKEILTEEIRSNWSYPDPVDCEIKFSTLRERAVAYGAAGMVLDRLFTGIEPVEGVENIRFGGVDLIPGWH